MREMRNEKGVQQMKLFNLAITLFRYLRNVILVIFKLIKYLSHSRSQLQCT